MCMCRCEQSIGWGIGFVAGMETCKLGVVVCA